MTSKANRSKAEPRDFLEGMIQMAEPVIDIFAYGAAILISLMSWLIYLGGVF